MNFKFQIFMIIMKLFYSENPNLIRSKIGSILNIDLNSVYFDYQIYQPFIKSNQLIQENIFSL